MHRNDIPVIVPRFTLLVLNFVIRFYQVTEFFCSRYLVTGSFSARRPRNIGPFAYFAIWIFREVQKKL